MTQRPVHRRRINGYTLVELVLVVAIVAVLAGIAVPRYGRGAARYRADAVAKRIAAELQQAQQRARSGSGPCTILFDTATSSFAVTYPTIGGVAGRTIRTDLTLPPYAATIRAANFGGGNSLSFNGYGKPSSAGTLVVGSGNEQRTITVSAVTGAVAVN